MLAPIGDRPFLDYLLEWLTLSGARRIVLCLGHLARSVTAYLEKNSYPSLTVIPVIEPQLAGTAGAIRFARQSLRSDPVLVINGDTFVDVDLPSFVTDHLRSEAAISMLGVQVPSKARYGSLELDATGYVARFVEKGDGSDGPGLVNGGMYLFSSGALDDLAKRSGRSLEQDFLQQLPGKTIKVHQTRGAFIDIGTPESLTRAADVSPRALASVRSRQVSIRART